MDRRVAGRPRKSCSVLPFGLGTCSATMRVLTTSWIHKLPWYKGMTLSCVNSDLWMAQDGAPSSSCMFHTFHADFETWKMVAAHAAEWTHLFVRFSRLSQRLFFQWMFSWCGCVWSRSCSARSFACFSSSLWRILREWMFFYVSH